MPVPRFTTALLGACLAACMQDQSPPSADRAEAGVDAPPTADLLLLDGAVFTMNPDRPWAEALAIKGPDIVAVGDTDAMRQMAGEGTRTIDLAGRMVLPGFHDAHLHLVYGGLQIGQCNLFEAGSPEAISEALVDCDQASPGEDWLLGSGWELSLFDQGNASKDLIDAVVPHRPVMLEGSDGHSIWVNSKALEMADIGVATEPPPGGIIERNAAGEPSGTLREDANQLIRALVPEPTLTERLEAVGRAQALAHSVGITSVIDAASNRSDMEALADYDRQGNLQMRVLASLMYSGYWKDEPGMTLFDEREQYRSSLVRPDSAKIFVDGVLEGETAALLEPYIGERHHSGELAIESNRLADAVAELDGMGIQVHMHAIGDAAVRAALDAIAAARSARGGLQGRHHIAHLQMIDPADYPRFAELGVTANFQALWAYPDDYITKINLPALGQERVDRMYPIGSLARAGARIVGGSDWTVSSINPLEAIETAITRSDVAGVTPGALNAEESVDLNTMLAAYTTNSAWLMSQETTVGSIAPGKKADLVVLERNLFEIDVSQIGETQVDFTLFDGEVVYAR